MKPGVRRGCSAGLALVSGRRKAQTEGEGKRGRELLWTGCSGIIAAYTWSSKSSLVIVEEVYS